MNYKLPKKYLSYSAITLWLKDKNAFRDKYYFGIEPPSTPFMVFGKEVAKILEDGKGKDDPVLKKIPQYPVSEHPIFLTYKNIPLVSYLDSFNPKTNAFLEYKTGIVSFANGNPWNQVKVQKHDQLPFYSFMIKEKYGSVQPQTKLVWLETAWQEMKVLDDDGFEKDERKLYLTGNIEIFKRKIEDFERERIATMIERVAKEIHDDYSSVVIGDLNKKEPVLTK